MNHHRYFSAPDPRLIVLTAFTALWCTASWVWGQPALFVCGLPVISAVVLQAKRLIVTERQHYDSKVIWVLMCVVSCFHKCFFEFIIMCISFGALCPDILCLMPDTFKSQHSNRKSLRPITYEGQTNAHRRPRPAPPGRRGGTLRHPRGFSPGTTRSSSSLLFDAALANNQIKKKSGCLAWCKTWFIQ